ncbi:MAG: hypothetical protein DRP78_03805 [Candidatus Omnitrophota bacterium]|nr:MAG: hypothetical protein DRP78_03805 [Candidatus Omnitrophota bacterium]
MENISKFLEDFIAQGEEMLRNAHEQAIILEASLDDRNALNSLFRIYHTLKGGAAMLGLTAIKQISHKLEDVLAAIRDGCIRQDKPLLTLLWKGSGFIADRIELLKTTESSQPLKTCEDEFISLLEDKLSGFYFVQKQDKVSLRSTDNVRYFCDKLDVTRNVFIIRAFLDKIKSSKGETADTDNFMQNVLCLSNIFRANAKEQSVCALEKMISDFELLVSDDGTIDDFLYNLLAESFQNALQGIAKQTVQQAPAKPSALRVFKIEPTFRIKEESIDELLKSVQGIDEAEKLFFGVRDILNQQNADSGLRLKMHQALNILSFARQDLFQMLVKIKLVSPDLLLKKIEKLVCSLAQSCDKNVCIETECLNTLVERANMEILENVLIHIVRNCIDHGIEMSGERLAQGKPEQGRIKISISEDENNLFVAVEDDGKGIDFQALRTNAYKSGKITIEQRDLMTDSDAVKLLFAPGVTTAKQITDVSGRGVGMDVVLNLIEKAQGTINISSVDRQGTNILISLPRRFKQ